VFFTLQTVREEGGKDERKEARTRWPVGRR